MVNPILIVGCSFQNSQLTETPATSEQYALVQMGANLDHVASHDPLPKIEINDPNSFSASFEQQLDALIREEADRACLKIETEVEREQNFSGEALVMTHTETVAATNENENSINNNEDLEQTPRATYTNEELRQFYKDLLKPSSVADQADRITEYGFTSEELDRMNHICDVMDRFWKVVGSKRVMLGKPRR